MVLAVATGLGGCAGLRGDDARSGPVPAGGALAPDVHPADVTGPDAPRSPLLGEVGERTDEGAPRYAMRVLAALGLHPPAALTEATTGPELLATVRGLLARGPRPLAGDLLFFDGGEVVAVATAARGDTTEFVYVRNGVVRRGVVTPDQPGEKRDREGRALNTFVRPWARSDRKGQRYLAGQIYEGVLRLDRLVARTPNRLVARNPDGSEVH